MAEQKGRRESEHLDDPRPEFAPRCRECGDALSRGEDASGVHEGCASGHLPLVFR